MFHKTFDRIAPILMADFIKTFKLTPEQAAGFVGNFGAESSLISGQQEGEPLGTTAPIRGRTGGIDWPQWTGQSQGGRRRAFGDFVESKGLSYPSYAASWAFVQEELRTTHRHALEQVRKTTTLEAAVKTAEAHYEKAGVKNWPARLAHAARALTLYQNSEPSSPVEEVTITTLQRDLASLSKTVSDLVVQVAKLSEEINK